MKRNPPSIPRDGRHRYDVRVYYEDTDAGGVAYHASYLRFAERARTEALRDAGIPHAELLERFTLMFVVRRIEVDYLRPARLDEFAHRGNRAARRGRCDRDVAPGRVWAGRVVCRVDGASRLREAGGGKAGPSAATLAGGPCGYVRSRAGQGVAVDRAVDAANLATPGVDLSLWGLFMEADIVVKIVMLGLLAASVWVWAVVFEKWSSLRKVNREADGFEDRFWSGGSLEDLFENEAAHPSHPMAAVFGSAMGEWRRSVRVAGADISRSSVRERIDRAITVTVQREMDRLERWMIFLASVGATAPFIGLFGTVWGIMHSFSAIAAMHNTNLAVVAPGIAEALFATAIGLVAAIPAVLAYNKISNDLARFAARLEGFGAEFSAILSRQSEERA